MSDKKEWANLTPRELMSCYEQVCKQYRALLAAHATASDLDIRTKIIQDALIDDNKVLFYYV
jgi:hypothetical protein